VKRLRVLAAPVLVVAACSLGPTAGSELGEPAPGSLRVLFIGNSLTYTNDLPQTVADLAASAGVSPCYCAMVAYPNYALVDHLQQGTAVRELATRGYDFVVMQQGPSSQPDSRILLLEGVTGFEPLVEQSGATIAMYSVWPSIGRQGDFPEALNSYRIAADSMHGILMPASAAWLAAWDIDPTLALYSSDGLHPSPMGTYLAALVIFQRLYGRSPIGVQSPARIGGRTYNWSPNLLLLLQQAAARANEVEGHP
jgi:hypothetical protein